MELAYITEYIVTQKVILFFLATPQACMRAHSVHTPNTGPSVHMQVIGHHNNGSNSRGHGTLDGWLLVLLEKEYVDPWVYIQAADHLHQK